MTSKIDSRTIACRGREIDVARTNYQRARRSHWDAVARYLDRGRWWGDYYQRRLADIYRFAVPPGMKVLELGCGRGDLLAALNPELGVGVDFSGEMLKRARSAHPELLFVRADAHCLPVVGRYDVIILSDLINDLWDVQAVFDNLRPHVHFRTRIILNFYSRLWELPLVIAQKLGVAKRNLGQNWFTVGDTEGLLELSDFEALRGWQEILFPFDIPLVSPLFNRVLVRFWPVRHLAMTNFIIARPSIELVKQKGETSISIVVPARNEAGNIDKIFDELPSIGDQLELIFVEGHSHDDTYQAIERNIESHPNVVSQLLSQRGEGKGDAVRLGFSQAKGDVLMILDADLSVAPQDLPRFYEALTSRKGEFISGVRLVYPMEQGAMRFLNLVANKLSGWAFSWLLGQKIRDTLCGTKVLWRSDYERIAANRAHFGDFDPFGDYDLLFGAAKLNLKIAELPIRYRERTYGKTNIQRWRHGWLLLRMLAVAMKRIKFA